jgi:hypothetical protein
MSMILYVHQFFFYASSYIYMSIYIYISWNGPFFKNVARRALAHGLGWLAPSCDGPAARRGSGRLAGLAAEIVENMKMC